MKTQASLVPTRPRHYAALIVRAAGDIALQREIFEACPFEMRAQVRDLTKLALHRFEKEQEHLRLVRQAGKKDPTPHLGTKSVRPIQRSDPEFGRQRLSELRAAVGGAV